MELPRWTIIFVSVAITLFVLLLLSGAGVSRAVIAALGAAAGGAIGSAVLAAYRRSHQK
jgi:membrane associated rhomboid family serine protease